LYGALDRAMQHFKAEPEDWKQLTVCNLNTELSWGRSASDYVNLYNDIALQ
jgi:glycogen synthase